MTVKEFMSYLMNNYCPHDIFRNMEPDKRCDRFMEENSTMACIVCWITNITERNADEVEE